MLLWGRLRLNAWPYRWPAVWLLAGATFLAFVWWLRHIPYQADPLIYSYLEVVGGLLAFTYAANALVRFQGTYDRISLILAFGFSIAGLIDLSSSISFYSLTSIDSAGQLNIPLSWMVSRTLLGLLMVTALVVERRLPNARNPGREIVAAFIIVSVVAYITSVAYLGSGLDSAIRPDARVPRLWALLPAAFFLAAVIGFRKRPGNARSSLDRALYYAAWINLVCHILASQSERLLDAPFALAEVLKVSSYALVLGGALLENARLFDQVRRMAVSDPLTGLANYRRFVDVLGSEIYRADRTARALSVLLLDLDGLKKINDRLGHLTGTRAILRVADVLRQQCRVIDTAARYGGDEFVLVLPETSADAALVVGQRIRQRLADDEEKPLLSVSLGLAVYPRDGATPEALLSAADRGLYKMKARSKKKSIMPRVAACL